MENYSEKLLSFINSAVSPFHAVKAIEKRLDAIGYKELKETEKWKVEAGGKYYTSRNGSSLIAFSVPSSDFNGFMFAAAHDDSPSFKIKACCDKQNGKYLGVNTEKYGGMLMSTWMDRPLSVAGRVCVRDGDGIKTVLVDSEKPVLIIPSVAIHMNRSANDNASLNPATDMQPICGLDGGTLFSDYIASLAGVKSDDVISHDLCLYSNGGTVWGIDGSFVSSPRIDDLQCAYALTEGFVSAEAGDSIPVLCIFDNEEVGSTTKQGAASGFLRDTVSRICEALGLDDGDRCAKLANSFMVSADNGHAIHPNHPELSDANNCPKINKGIVVKYNANQRYTTDAISAAVFGRICESASVPCQVFANRSDMAGGGTLGNISNTQVALNTVDIGLAQLAMHSAYETAGTKDTEYLVRAMTKFFSSSVTFDGENIKIR